MNTNAAVAEQLPATITPSTDAFRARMLPQESRAELFRSLPSHIKPEVFERNLTNALMASPDLMAFPPAQVFREVSKAAGLGLFLDPQLGEAYIIVAYNYKSKKKEPQLRIGYRGMCKLARQSGNVLSIYAHEVCEHDEVECDLGFPKILHHRPVLFGDRGNVIGYLAVIAYASGAFDFEPMSVEQARGIRDRSDAWKAFKEDKIKSTPWSTDEIEMSKKTTLRRLLKRQDLSPELRTAIEIEDRAEFPDMRNVTPRGLPDDDGPPAPPPATQAAPLAPGDADLDLVESGRFDPREDDDWEEPLDPSNQSQPSRADAAERPSPSGEARQPPEGAAPTLLQELLAEIDKLTSNAEAYDWATENMGRINKLGKNDRRTFDVQFTKKQGGFSKAFKSSLES